MLPFFEQLQEATILKRFLDEFEKNPRRTIGALVIVVCLAGAGATVAFGEPSPPPRPLSELPSTEPKISPDGTLERLPEPRAAEAALSHTLAQNERRHQAVLEEFRSRSDDAEVTERDIKLLNDSGKVTY
jgi:hypothetical protein